MSEHEHLAIVLSVSRLKIDVIVSKKMIMMMLLRVTMGKLLIIPKKQLFKKSTFIQSTSLSIITER